MESVLTGYHFGEQPWALFLACQLHPFPHFEGLESLNPENLAVFHLAKAHEVVFFSARGFEGS